MSSKGNSKAQEQARIFKEEMHSLRHKIENLEIRNQKKIERIHKNYHQKKQHYKILNSKTFSAIQSSTSSSDSDYNYTPQHQKRRNNRFVENYGATVRGNDIKSMKETHNYDFESSSQLPHRRHTEELQYFQKSFQGDEDFEQQIQNIVDSYKFELLRTREQNSVLERSLAFFVQEVPLLVTQFEEKFIGRKMHQIEKELKKQQKKLIKLVHELQDSKQERRSSNLIKETQRRRSESKSKFAGNSREKALNSPSKSKLTITIPSTKSLTQRETKNQKFEEISLKYQNLIQEKNAEVEQLTRKIILLEREKQKDNLNFHENLNEVGEKLLESELQLQQRQLELQRYQQNQTQLQEKIKMLERQLQKAFEKDLSSPISARLKPDCRNAQRRKANSPKFQKQLKQLDSLREEIQSKEIQFDQSKKLLVEQIKNSQFKIEEMQKEQFDLKKQIIQKDSAIEGAKRSKEQLEKKFEVNLQRIAEFEQIIKSDDNNSQQMKELLEKSLCGNVDSEQIQKVEDLEAEIASIQSALSEKEWQIVHLCKENTKLKAQNQRLNNETTELTIENCRLKEIEGVNPIERSSKPKSFLKFSFGAQEMQEEIKHEKAALPSLQKISSQNCFSDQESNESFKSALQKSSAENSNEYEKERLIIEEQLKSLRLQNEVYSQKMSEMSNEMSRLKTRIVSVESENIKNVSDMGFLSSEIKELKEGLSRKKHALMERQMECKKLLKQVKGLEQEKSQLISNCSRLQGANGDLERAIEELKREPTLSCLNTSNLSESMATEKNSGAQSRNVLTASMVRQIQSSEDHWVIREQKARIEELEGNLRQAEQLHERALQKYREGAEKLAVSLRKKEKEAAGLIQRYEDTFRQLCQLKQSLYAQQENNSEAKSNGLMLRDLLQENEKLALEAAQKAQELSSNQSLVAELYELLAKKEAEINSLTAKDLALISSPKMNQERADLSQTTNPFRKMNSPKAGNKSLLDQFLKPSLQENLLSNSIIEGNGETLVENESSQLRPHNESLNLSYTENVSVLYGREDLIEETAKHCRNGRKEWSKLFQTTAKYVKGLKETISRQSSKIKGLEKVIEVIKQSEHFKEGYIHHFTTEVSPKEASETIKDYESERASSRRVGEARHWKEKYLQICNELKLVMEENQMLITQAGLMEEEIAKGEENENNLISVKNLYKNECFALESRHFKEIEKMQGEIGRRETEIKRLREELEIRNIEYEEGELYKLGSKVFEQYSGLLELCERIIFSPGAARDEQKDDFIDKRHICEENLNIFKRYMLKAS